MPNDLNSRELVSSPDNMADFILHTIYVYSKNKKKYHTFSSENYHFYSREKMQYIA